MGKATSATRSGRALRVAQEVRVTARAMQSEDIRQLKQELARGHRGMRHPKRRGSILGAACPVHHFGDAGGEKGIRTLETVPRLHTFQACAFDHSAISPRGSPIIRLCGLCQGARGKKAAKLFFPIPVQARVRSAFQTKQVLLMLSTALPPLPSCRWRLL